VVASRVKYVKIISAKNASMLSCKDLKEEILLDVFRERTFDYREMKTAIISLAEFFNNSIRTCPILG
jgi:hypothetical protein